MGGLVSGVSSLLGGGANNSGFEASSIPVAVPVNTDNINNASQMTNSAMKQQQALATALAGQHGIQNQSSVFNQLQGVANGTGPNPAAAQLAQATGANTANQAALMAGQRGAGANAGLIARQAAQQGAANQQNAIGQAATLQANQSLGALGQLGGLAGQQVAQQQGALNSLGQQTLGQESTLLNGFLGGQGQQVQMQTNQNNANSAMAQTNANNSSKFIGGMLNGAGGAAMSFLADGGEVPQAIPNVAEQGDSGGGAGSLMKMLPMLAALAQGGQVQNPKAAEVPAADRFTGSLMPHVEHLARIYHPHKFAQGGKVDAMVSPGEVYLPPAKAKEVAKEGKNPLKEGEKIPGKPKFAGNNYGNDVVHKELKSGGVVIPNSIMQSDDPAGKAAEFVKKLVEKSGGKKEHGDFKDALKKAIASRKVH